jgi:hypothetical protein
MMKNLIIIAIVTLSMGRFFKPASHSNSLVVPMAYSHWDSTKNWKLYKLSNFNGVFRIPEDSLQYLASKPLNDDSMHILLSSAIKLQDINPMWQGCYLASYQNADGQTRKVIISHYGGFFYCQPDHVYFQVSPNVEQQWLEYLSDSYININRNAVNK